MKQISALFHHLLLAGLLSILALACASVNGRRQEDSAVQALGSQTYRTFATTFAANPRYACGYTKAMVDELIKADNVYFVAISAASYDASHCGRLLDITIKSQCGNGSKIDEGYCLPEKTAINKNIKAIIVDRCPDAKKCMPPSLENKELGHDVKVHIDLGPQEKAIAKLGDKANYDITWRFASDTYAPKAYVVFGSGYADYVRIGLITAQGVQSIKVNGSVWNKNSSQAEFAGVINGARNALTNGLPIEVQHSNGSVQRYIVKSNFASFESFGSEKIYPALIRAP